MLPWMRFYTRDWLDSKELRRCSPTSRAILIDLMCLAQEGFPYGHLADKVGRLTCDYMSSRCMVAPAVFSKSIAELVEYKRIETLPDGTVVIPRMVEDEKNRVKRSEDGGKGGNPKLVKAVVNHRVEPQDILARARADSDSNSSFEGKDSKGKETPISRPAHMLDEPFTILMKDYEESTPLIEADYPDAHREWLAMDMGERMTAIANFREKRGLGLFSDPAMVMRPAKWLKRKEFNRRAVKPKPATNGSAAEHKSPYRLTTVEEMGWDGKVDES